MKPIKLLKVFVYFMAVLIFVLLGALFYGFSITGKDGIDPAAGEQTYTMFLGEPEGSRVRHFVAAGEMVILHLEGGGMPVRFLVFDTNNGRVVGRVNLGQSP